MHRLQCTITYNYGQNLNILAGILILSILVFIICKIALGSLKPASSAHRLFSIINRCFGLRYFFVFFDAISLEMFGLCLMNFAGIGTKSSSVIVGFIISVIIMVAYVIMYAYAFWSIRKLV